MKDPKEFQPGLYEHYKGDRYIALHIVSHHETNELFVVYVSCSHGTINLREWDSPGKDSWCDPVTKVDLPSRCLPEYAIVPRFQYLLPALHVK